MAATVMVSTVITRREDIATQASNSGHIARSKKWLLVVVAMLSGLDAIFSARLLLVETLVLPELRFEELRLFDPARAYAPPFAGGLFEKIDGITTDATAISSMYAECRKQLIGTASGTDATAPAIARDKCLAVLAEGLARTPASGALWVERAALLLSKKGGENEAFQALRTSQVIAPREAWIVASRLRLTVRVWHRLPDDLRQKALADTKVLLSSNRLARQLAEIYVREAGVREAVGKLVAQTDLTEQLRFIWSMNSALNIGSG
jgi:hypothetical protein